MVFKAHMVLTHPSCSRSLFSHSPWWNLCRGAHPPKAGDWGDRGAAPTSKGAEGGKTQKGRLGGGRLGGGRHGEGGGELGETRGYFEEGDFEGRILRGEALSGRGDSKGGVMSPSRL